MTPEERNPSRPVKRLRRGGQRGDNRKDRLKASPGNEMRDERYGLSLLLVSVILGLLFDVVLTLAPNAILTAPSFRVGNASLAIRL